eukprot:COSAG05_NODE_25_length_31349_cov_4.978560_13_plen_420_part_00
MPYWQVALAATTTRVASTPTMHGPQSTQFTRPELGHSRHSDQPDQDPTMSPAAAAAACPAEASRLPGVVPSRFYTRRAISPAVALSSMEAAAAAPAARRLVCVTRALTAAANPEQSRQYRFLTLRRDGHVLYVTHSNPPKYTIVSQGTDELLHVAQELNDPDSRLHQPERVRVLVITGDPTSDFFIKHFDLDTLADSAASQQGHGGAQPDMAGASGRAAIPPPPVIRNPQRTALGALNNMHQLTLALESSPVITVAAMNGFGVGGGTEVALGCDFRLMADGPKVRMGLPETSVGILPGGGGVARFARMLGTAKAMDLMLHAKVIKPHEALALGLVNRLYPDGDAFLPDVKKFADDLAGRAPLALARVKAIVQQANYVDLKDSMRLESTLFGELMGSADALNAMQTGAKTGKPFTAWTGE